MRWEKRTQSERDAVKISYLGGLTWLSHNLCSSTWNVCPRRNFEISKLLFSQNKSKELKFMSFSRHEFFNTATHTFVPKNMKISLQEHFIISITIFLHNVSSIEMKLHDLNEIKHFHNFAWKISMEPIHSTRTCWLDWVIIFQWKFFFLKKPKTLL